MTKAPIYIRLKLTLPPTQRCAFSAPCELNKFNILGKKDEDKIDNTFHMPHLAAETHTWPPHISHSTLSIPHPTPEHRHVFHKKDVKNKRNEEKGNNLLYVLFRTTVIKSSFRSLSTAGGELLFVVHQGHIGTGLIVFVICWRLCLRFLCRLSFQVTVYGGRSRMSA